MLNFIDEPAKAQALGIDEIAIIFSFLSPRDILRARVCTAWKNAAKNTIVPPVDPVMNEAPFDYNALKVMSTALPNLQQLTILNLPNEWNKYLNGEDPEEGLQFPILLEFDINIISNFSKLRKLNIHRIRLNGRYPALFNFPLLQSLIIDGNPFLKVDLEEVATGSPLLKELKLDYLPNLTGNLNSLKALKDTLESVYIRTCCSIRGNFMCLADFPDLKDLHIEECTSITGDIRDISGDDFPSLEIEYLYLPETVVGGVGYSFQRIRDVPSFMEAIKPLVQRCSMPLIDCEMSLFRWKISSSSPDWYAAGDTYPTPPPPLHVQIVQAGSRLGWRWYSSLIHESRQVGNFIPMSIFACEINWLGPEPSSDEDYFDDLEQLEDDINLYEGYHHPPSEQEYLLTLLHMTIQRLPDYDEDY